MNIKKAPFTAKEIDLLTGAERYMRDLLELPLIQLVKNCFSDLPSNTVEKINRVWECYIAAFHLKQSHKTKPQHLLLINATQIYELEGQRILGALFPLDHNFWTTFYKRQETTREKPLLAIDALHHLNPTQIEYQLLLQALKAILKAHYLEPQEKNQHYQNAQRLLVDMPLIEFHNWLNEQMI